MVSLENIAVLLALGAAAAWLWHGHGRRELALALARKHCAKLDIELLDGNVAFRRIARQRDGSGHWRLARVYDFEFTVTGEQRLKGQLSLFGKQLGRIELDAHPLPEVAPRSLEPGNVINLEAWRSSHSEHKDQ